MDSIATLAALGTRETVEEIPEHLLLALPEGASPVQFRTIVINKRIVHAVPSPGAARGLLEITVSKNPGTAEITVKDFVEGLGIAPGTSGKVSQEVARATTGSACDGRATSRQAMSK